MRPDGSGNRRAGILCAGAVLLFLGLGLGVILNLLLHESASSGTCVSVPGLLTVCAAWGWGATIVLCIGVFTAIIGAALLVLGLQLPPAPLSLFDTEGKYPPDPSQP